MLRNKWWFERHAQAFTAIFFHDACLTNTMCDSGDAGGSTAMTQTPRAGTFTVQFSETFNAQSILNELGEAIANVAGSKCATCHRRDRKML